MWCLLSIQTMKLVIFCRCFLKEGLPRGQRSKAAANALQGQESVTRLILREAGLVVIVAEEHPHSHISTVHECLCVCTRVLYFLHLLNTEICVGLSAIIVELKSRFSLFKVILRDVLIVYLTFE